MALHLIDGLPGTGKTQFAIKQVLALAEKATPPRPVYYNNIRGLKLPWVLIEANDWQSCPDGAIVVIDEVQSVWGVRPSGSRVPDHIAALATHRHRGFDIFIITQDGSLLDQNARKVAGPYLHVERKSNFPYSKVWRFDGWCQWSSPTNQASADLSRYEFDKDIWKLYDSATVHTHTARIPRRVLWLVPALGALVGGAWYAYATLQGSGQNKKAAAAAPVAKGQPLVSSPGSGSLGAQPKTKLTPEEYIKELMPRVPVIAHSAPVYDDLTRPVSFPVISACVEREPAKWCTCYSQQGTPMAASYEFCHAYVKHGAYDHFRVDASRGASDQRQGFAVAPGQTSRAFSASSVALKLPDR